MRGKKFCKTQNFGDRRSKNLLSLISHGMKSNTPPTKCLIAGDDDVDLMMLTEEPVSRINFDLRALVLTLICFLLTSVVLFSVIHMSNVLVASQLSCIFTILHLYTRNGMGRLSSVLVFSTETSSQNVI